MRTVAPHQKILDLIRISPPVDVQNRILRIRDEDLALSMLYMVDDQIDRVLAFAGGAKALRVREALARLRHTRILYAQYEEAARDVIRSLKGDRGNSTSRTGGGRRSYYRPRQPS